MLLQGSQRCDSKFSDVREFHHFRFGALFGVILEQILEQSVDIEVFLVLLDLLTLLIAFPDYAFPAVQNQE